jgi:hypothetical protein
VHWCPTWRSTSAAAARGTDAHGRRCRRRLALSSRSHGVARRAAALRLSTAHTRAHSAYTRTRLRTHARTCSSLSIANAAPTPPCTTLPIALPAPPRRARTGCAADVLPLSPSSSSSAAPAMARPNTYTASRTHTYIVRTHVRSEHCASPRREQ